MVRHFMNVDGVVLKYFLETLNEVGRAVINHYFNATALTLWLPM